MGFEPGSLLALSVTATLPSFNGSAGSNSVVYLRSADRSMRATMVCGFLAYKTNLGRIETRTRDKKYLGWCDQFETSPDAIEPELRTALCERST